MLYTKLVVIVVALLASSVNFSLCARILFVLPAPSLSHHIFYRQIIKEILFRGHEVVSITPDPINDPKLTNLTEIDIHKETYEVIDGQKWLEEAQYQPSTEVNRMRLYLPLLRETADQVLSAPKVKQLIQNQNEYFDLVIVEMLNMDAHFFGFRERFHCPAIGITSLDTTLNGMDAIGNPPHPSYYGSFFTEYSGENLSFWERLLLLWHHIDYRFFYHYQYLPISNEMIVKHFNITTKTAWDLEKSVDVVLTNTNSIFHVPQPKVPNLIDIGGLHTREKKPLPKELKQFLDNSKHGVIYFSLGSNIKSGNLPPEKRAAILEAFKKLPYNILWKFETEALTDKPANVFTQNWLPQQDVLDHPNLKAFITQGGIQSLEEAIRSSVPMICIPFGGDQKFNARRIFDLGIGLSLSFDDITSDTLKDAINEVAGNPKFKTSITKLAKVMYDQPTKPLDRAIWWIEYVIRHGGARHLRCPAADLPWYKYLLLDIIGFIFGIAIFCLMVVVCLVKVILRFVTFNKLKFKRE